MGKRLQELESTGAFEELRREVHMVMNFVAADVNQEIQALKVFEAVTDAKIQAYEARVEALEAQLKVSMAAVVNAGNSGLVQVSITLKGNVLLPPTYNGAKNVREIDNFFWKLEAYFLSLIHI